MVTRRIESGLMSLVLVLLLCSAAVPLYAGDPDPLNGIDAYVEKTMADWNVPGLALAVVKDDQVVLARGYGLLEAGKSEPVTERTLFRIGSITKSFMTTALGMLVDEGKLSWDDPVIDHLPEFRLADPWVTRHVTLRDALSHRTGIERADGLTMLGYDSKEMVRRLRYAAQDVEFRSGFKYNNLMYVLAGEVFQGAIGQPWSDFVTERLFKPLGLASTSAKSADFLSASDAAAPHALVDGQIRVLPDLNVDVVGPAGAIGSNVLDMAQWVRFQLNGGRVADKQLLSTRTHEEMWTPQSIARTDDPEIAALYPGAHFGGYGLGWVLTDYAGRKMVEHSGGIIGMTALLTMIPEERLGMVVLTNLEDTYAPYPIRQEVLARYLGLEERDWNGTMKSAYGAFQEMQRAREAQAEASRVPGTQPSLALDRLAGTYENDLYGPLQVEVRNETLTIRPPREGTIVEGDLRHWQYDTFRLTWRVPAPLLPTFATFALGPDGSVSALTIDELGTFSRAPAG